jgi:mediator of RNA polymerase II transcription subunit 31
MMRALAKLKGIPRTSCSFLSYLRYFHQPRYARFVHYPQALHILELLQEESFREAVRSEQVVAELMRKQLVHWATWRGGKKAGGSQLQKGEDAHPNG